MILWEILPEFFQKSIGKSYSGNFSERPSGEKATAMAWSNYKHHNSMKIILLDITPEGVILFVLESGIGCVSDKCLTERSSILLPGGVVLVDCGFNIDLVAVKQANLNIPVFTK